MDIDWTYNGYDDSRPIVPVFIVSLMHLDYISSSPSRVKPPRPVDRRYASFIFFALWVLADSLRWGLTTDAKGAKTHEKNSV